MATIVAAATGQLDLLLAIMALSIGLYSFINNDKITGLVAMAMAATSLLTLLGECVLSKLLKSPLENKEIKIMSGILSFTSLFLGATINMVSEGNNERVSN